MSWRAHVWIAAAAAAAGITAAIAVAASGAPLAAPSLSLAAAGDIGTSARASATLRRLARERPDFVLALGDLSYGGPGSEPGWCQYVHRLLGSTPVELVSGNHEDDTGTDGRIAAFARCLPDRLGGRGAYGREYFFDYGRLARFILISPDLTIDKRYYYYGKGTRHLRWLRQAIEGARAAGIRWVVVGMHKSCLSVGEYDCKIYQDALDLLVREKVDLVLQAHDHTFQRTHQLGVGPGCPRVVIDRFNRSCIVDSGLDGRYRRHAGAVFVVVGTGGAPLYPVHPRDPEAGYFAAYAGANRKPAWGFLRVTVTADRLEGRFVASTPTSFADGFSITAR